LGDAVHDRLRLLFEHGDDGVGQCAVCDGVLDDGGVEHAGAMDEGLLEDGSRLDAVGEH
jgi:hypothetical protein